MPVGGRRKVLLFFLALGGFWVYFRWPSSFNSSFFRTNSSASPESDDEQTNGDPRRPFQPFPLHRPLRSGEKYLSYLPHSQFHNQRTILQNALSLALYLNRTLLLPPIWVGEGGPPRSGYDVLQKLGRIEYKGMFCFNRATPRWKKQRERGAPSSLLTMRLESSFANRWWGDGTGERAGMTEEGARLDAGGIGEDDVYYVKESSKDELQFTTHLPSTDLTVPFPPWQRTGVNKYQTSFSLQALRKRRESLILFGSLFGSGRLNLSDSDGVFKPSWFEKRLILRNNAVSHISQLIASALEEVSRQQGYYAVLARVGDGIFAKKTEEYMDNLFTRIVTLILVEEGRESAAEEVLLRLRKLTEEPKRLSKQLQVVNRDESGGIRHCNYPLHTDPALHVFNAPLYMATDSRSPKTDPNLFKFFRAFPCTFTLGDWDGMNVGIAELAAWKNVDGEKLGGFFIPMLDSMVAARGKIAIGTQGSSYGDYVEKVLHPAVGAKHRLT
ncbi:hypothetical protein BT69DRAFT_1279298 [Atractiella rhizophila]|nr:hypothetical protein BT69DRAFT_1279298 [Atractiella rhizophila]